MSRAGELRPRVGLSAEVLKALGTLKTKEEIKEAWDVLKQKWGQLDAQAAFQFNIGDEVEWDGKKGLQRGTVQKINQKSVSVDVKDATAFGGVVTWKVSATLLKKVTKETHA